MLPNEEDFPYTIRVVSDILESNGSSSMATVCGGSLALFDAGVPLLAPVAGVAMGLVQRGDNFAVLTDIAGQEDHYGDMDFKVAGTRKGITALQMDIKVGGVSKSVMETALEQARLGRLHILGKMEAIIGMPASGSLRPSRRGSTRSRSTRRRSATSSDPAARRSARSSRRPVARSRSRTTAA